MNVGFIGLGNIGKPMALNVVGAGHRTTVHDIRREAATDVLEAGATWAETPADAAQGSDVVMGSLPGPLEVEAVVRGAGRAGWGCGGIGVHRPGDELAEHGAEAARDMRGEGRGIY